MPNGDLLREHFEDMEALNKRREELEKQGAKVERVFTTHRGRKVWTDNNKYKPHQGKLETARRRKQLRVA